MNICRRSVDIKPGELRFNWKTCTRSSFGTFEDVAFYTCFTPPTPQSVVPKNAARGVGVPYSGGVRHCPQQSLKIPTFLPMAMAMAMAAVRET